MVHRRAVHTDLMRAPGLYPYFEQGYASKGFPDLPGCFRGSPFSTSDGHLLAVHWMPADGERNRAGLAFHPSVNHCQVFFSYSPGLELLCQSLLGDLVFGHHQRSGCILIQAMDDSRS
jgi:hypothetical protein